MRLIDADILKKWFVENNWQAIIISKMNKIIDAQPTVRQETSIWLREEGTILFTESGSLLNIKFRCATCGMGSVVNSRYCPNCGAEMKGIDFKNYIRED